MLFIFCREGGRLARGRGMLLDVFIEVFAVPFVREWRALSIVVDRCPWGVGRISWKVTNLFRTFPFALGIEDDCLRSALETKDKLRTS